MCQVTRVGAAYPCKKEEPAEYHGNGVQWVTEEKNKLLNERHLDEEKRQTEQKEITAHSSTGVLRPTALDTGQGQEDQKDAGEHRLNYCGDQDEITPFDQAGSTTFA